jgi:exodeoxyribonuclease-3
MKIASYNVNGLRAAIRKGFLEWLEQESPDVLCLQEVKALPADLDLSLLERLGYQHNFFAPAEKKGYSGVAILSKTAPHNVVVGHGAAQSDAEGRLLRADFGDVTVLSAYFPSGSAGTLRQTYKFQWLEELQDTLEKLHHNRREKILLCGDYNMAHRAVDVHNPKSASKLSGFLPAEQEWMERFFQSGYHDTFRHFNPEATGAYSWWNQRMPRLRTENKGWRIDCIAHSAALHPHMTDAGLLPDAVHSDHCPVYVSYEL